MEPYTSRSLSRRSFVTAGAGAAGAIILGTRLIAPAAARRGPALASAPSAATTHPQKSVHLVGTDGWVSMPQNGKVDLPFFPDPLAPSGLNTYVFGFRDATGLDASGVAALRGKAQISAPMLAFDEEDDISITLTNLGLSMRPDLFDGHTLHWHGFVNAIPLFDGVPELSLAAPVGRDLQYFYRPHDAGTYMYHCHFEDVEHVQMGMTGMVFVRPKQNRTPVNGDPVGTTYAYNDGDGSTRYDREFAFMLTELWSAAHYRDAHIQVSDWTDYQATFSLLNGRGYPDTVAPNNDPGSATHSLQYQPLSSLVTCNPGERVLLRLSNLGYKDHSLTADNLDLTVVAKDATLLRGRDGTRNYLQTGTVTLGGGESRDVIFTAPGPGEYLLYDRDYNYLSNGGSAGWGGMMTKIVVADPARPFPPQLQANA